MDRYLHKYVININKLRYIKNIYTVILFHNKKLIQNKYNLYAIVRLQLITC